MSIKPSHLMSIAAVAAGLISVSVLPADSAHKYRSMDAGSSEGGGCPSWNRPAAQRSWSCTVTSDAYNDGGLGFRLFWEPPLSDRAKYGNVSPTP